MDHWHSFFAEVPGQLSPLDIINNKLYSAMHDRGNFKYHSSMEIVDISVILGNPKST